MILGLIKGRCSGVVHNGDRSNILSRTSLVIWGAVGAVGPNGGKVLQLAPFARSIEPAKLERFRLASIGEDVEACTLVDVRNADCRLKMTEFEDLLIRRRLRVH